MTDPTGGIKAVVSRLVTHRTKALAAATAVLVVVGLIAFLADHDDLTILTVLLLQACLAGYLVTGSAAASGLDEDTLQKHIDRASARSLADLTRTRQAILEAVEPGSTTGTP